MGVCSWMLWRWQWLLEIGPTMREVRRARRRARVGEAAVLNAIWVELSRARGAVARAVTLDQDVKALAAHLHLRASAARGIALRLRGAPWGQVRAVAGDGGCRRLEGALATLWVSCAGAQGGRGQPRWAAEHPPCYGRRRSSLPRRPRVVRPPSIRATGLPLSLLRQGGGATDGEHAWGARRV